MGRQDYETETLVAHAFDARQSDVLQYGDRTGPLDTDGHSVAVAFAQNTRDEVREMPVVGALAAQPGMKQTSYVRADMQVRRLTPRECERLQGFPDDYTAIPWRGKPASECPDGPRYKSLGNSMAVPVMRWIGEQIAAVDQAG
jgi:DNA (cytosine-5)-methyltransferase 1